MGHDSVTKDPVFGNVLDSFFLKIYPMFSTSYLFDLGPSEVAHKS